jgi:tRNA(fMet)-specific endonuclease VapC
MVDVADGLLVVDTDLVIDFLRGSEPGASRVEGWLRGDQLRLTAISAFELRLGTDFVARSDRIAALLAHRTLPLDLLAGLRAGEVFAGLARKGSGIGLRDALIAGTCLRFELPLATRNRRHFERVEGLLLVAP